ncbi:DNA polymerase III subunit alpha [Vagococcus humatus]|uniref:DNA polymerase III subunit alpha n=1 Tax=Vagococcus humatus TaxID=1889241 RepID=A0A3R9YKA5_9ENTE|nr:DNA polymerase III subunit alpha [Vagococcus humatus]RST89674.1 DNA polymerase III subunit alpha [Vagococcus humatus]
MYTQLQVLTSYSLLKSTIRIDSYVAKAKEYGYQALAITDLNVMSGVVEFYKACQRYHIHPILGLTLMYENQGQEYPLILLAKDQLGYQHLLELSTLKMDNLENKPVNFQTIKDYLSHLFVIFPSGEGEAASQYRLNQDLPAFLKLWQQFAEVCDSDSLFQGVSIHEDSEEHVKWAKQLQKAKVPLVSLQDVRYLHPSDDFALRVLDHIQQGTKMTGDIFQQTGVFYLPDSQNMQDKFQRYGLQDALDHASYIGENCQCELTFGQTLLPSYAVPSPHDARSYLRELCLAQLPLRVKQPTSAYRQRLEMELQVIHDMGFDDYFLIVWDVLHYAHTHQIVTGAGRGSAAGSLVAYVLNITDVDPIQYDLLFERFLNKERYTMPDIDIDLPDNRREEVLAYVHQKYGKYHMAQIATFGTMAAKMVLRDVSRVFGLSQSEANEWANAVPNQLKISLKEAYQQSKSLQQLTQKSARYQLLFQVAQQLEGLPRHVSTHAAGVVISDKILTDIVPLQEGSQGIPLTQLTMGDVEALGLLKMDFLGLRNLSILDDTMTYIQQTEDKSFTLKKIPMNDPDTLRLFQKGQTIGVFQFESSGIRNVLRKLGPTSIEDIAAVNALYRPGPMENIDLFIARKKGQLPIDYPHANLASILKNTYGIIVYQEQIMQVAAKMAGFSLGQADILRRAISKKKKEVLDEERQHFVTGSVQQGYSKEVANQVYDYIERFANYGFNRSHAMAYSFVGYQMAYLKVHYPVPFFTALLHSVRHQLTKIKEYIGEARRCQIKIKGPDINQSFYSFSLQHQEILFGFSSLKGVRRDFIYQMLEERKRGGAYQSLENFLLRIDRRWLKEDYVLPLIYIGAFDSLNPNRKELATYLPNLMQNILISNGSLNLLSMLSLKKEPIEDFSIEERLAFEETYLGTYLSAHPTDDYQALRVIKNGRLISQLQVGEVGLILLYVKKIREIRTKKGEFMAFLEGSDSTDDLSITVFPKAYRRYRSLLKENQVYLIEGKVELSRYNQERQMLADTIQLASDYDQQVNKEILYIKLPKHLAHQAVSLELENVFQQFPGNFPIILYVEATDKKVVLNETFWVNKTSDLVYKLEELVGKENIVFR